jgi:hypothetical protein
LHRILIFSVGLVAVMGCTPEARDDVTRDAAKRAVRPVIADKFPGVPVEPAVDCIIDNAQSRELLALAADAITGPTASTAENVGIIASRPETLTCLATKGLPAFLK